ncbi:MAG TPA: hypothetical protein VKU41_19655 [Polyangiaceae bacterium]|nr:hypothetical protein [Polyangiaceae bacterium]
MRAGRVVEQVWGLAAAAWLCAGCSSSGPPLADGGAADSGDPGCFACGDAMLDLTPLAEVKAEIDITCSSTDGCHGTGAGINLVLTAGDEFSNLIGVPSTERPDLLRVKPGDPLNSYAFLKVWCDGGYERACMPLGQARTPQLTQFAQALHDWIEAGAPTP